jgi:peptidyl-prolyl cis-trans isomerase SurA
VAAAVSGLALLAGCGTAHPGAAAVVGSEQISQQQVADVAEALCTVNVRSGQGTDLPSRGALQSALSILIRTAVSQQFGRAHHVHADQSQVSAAVDANLGPVSSLPPDQAEVFRSTLRDYASGQLVVIEVGKRALARQGTTGATQDQELAAGERLRRRFEQGLDIQVDPRYGTWGGSDVTPGDGSLSVPVSQAAQQGASTDPGSSFAAGLPASQVCAG